MCCDKLTSPEPGSKMSPALSTASRCWRRRRAHGPADGYPSAHGGCYDSEASAVLRSQRQNRRSGVWSIRIGHSPPRCDRARDRTLGAGREQRSRAARPSHRVQRGRSAGYPKSTWRRRKLRPSRPTLHSAAPSGRRRSGNRPSIAPSAISVSRRATAAPRQWWMP